MLTAGTAPYPEYTGDALIIEDKNIIDTAMKPIAEEFEARLSQPFGSPMTDASIEWHLKNLKRLEAEIPSAVWDPVSPDGQMSLPSVMANNGRGMASGADSFYAIPLLAPDQEAVVPLTQYAYLWQSLLQHRPEVAFAEMAKAAKTSATSTRDVIRAYAALGYEPGASIPTTSPTKADWNRLYKSTNPAYQLIALEKFNLVEQSPQELLALYRKCLFEGCSYLEVRALYAIKRNQDSREEVAKLLDEYANLPPLQDDGTLPTLRNDFRNLPEDAKSLAKRIREELVAQGPQPTKPNTLPSVQATQTNPPPAPKEEQSPPPPTEKPTPPAETPEPENPTTLLYVILGLLVVAIVTVVLRKARKQ